MKRFAAGLLSVVAVFGMKFYNKGQTSGQVKQHLVTLCGGDRECTAALDRHFDSCFEQSYKMGGRRQSSRLEAADLVACLNSRAGRSYFTYNEK